MEAGKSAANRQSTGVYRYLRARVAEDGVDSERIVVLRSGTLSEGTGNAGIAASLSNTLLAKEISFEFCRASHRGHSLSRGSLRAKMT